MLPRILAAPFVICALYFLYMAWEHDTSYGMNLVPCVIALVVIYLFSPQINWWYYQRKPPKLPEPVLKLFMSRIPFFQHLLAAEKTKFCNRVALYIEANEFIPKAMPSVPLDVKAVIAASVVQLTFYHENYLLNKFEHIIVYPHPFPSPQFQEWHTSEIFEEDGVLMFSLEQLMAGFAQPNKFFHIGLYEYARVFRRCHPDIQFPDMRPDIWEKLQQVSGFSKAAIEKWIGLKNLETEAVAAAHYFIFPERFKMVLPDMFKKMKSIFSTPN